MSESGDSVLTWVYKAQPEVPLRSSERVWSARIGRVLWICRPASQRRVWVRPQPNGFPPSGSQRPGAAHGHVSFNWRDTSLPCTKPRRACLPKHDERALTEVYLRDVFVMAMQETLSGNGLSAMLMGTTRWEHGP